MLNFDVSFLFPIENEALDGVFCTGTLHLFPTLVLARIIEEMKRVVKPAGELVFDVATDIERNHLDGSPHVWKNEPAYSYDEAVASIRMLFPDYELKLTDSTVPKELVNIGERKHTFSCRLLLVSARKRLG